jgi:hypothetical protein
MTTTVTNTPQGVVSAISSNSSAFAQAMKALPQSVRHNGRAYSAKKATTAEQRAWYTAAAAVSAPVATAAAAKKFKGKLFDADASEGVTAARAALSEAAREKRRAGGEASKLRAKMASVDRQLEHWRRKKTDAGRFRASSLLFGITNAVKGDEADKQLRTYQAQKAELEMALAEEQGNLDRATEEEKAAQKDLDDALKAQRVEEEAARAAELRLQRERLEEERKLAEAEKAARAEAQYQAESERRAREAEQAAQNGGSYNPPAPPYSGGGYSYSNDEMTDIWGDPIYGADQLNDVGEVVPPAEFHGDGEYVSPYSSSVYYCSCPGKRCSGACKGNSPIYGADINVVSIIIAIIMAIAPIILSVLMPPPPMEDGGVTDGPDTTAGDGPPAEKEEGAKNKMLMIGAVIGGLILAS